nr:RNA 2',3'-cyclic phosphodiesterase [Porphyrobacter sp. GA68]
MFVALRPPAPVRAELMNLMGGVENARWQDETQLHLTLRFIGEVPPLQAQEIAAELGRVAMQPFSLGLRGVGHFERKGAAHTLWAGVADSPALGVLHGRVERACRRTGHPVETRRFAPHVTLARLNRSAGSIAGWLAAHGDFASIPWPVDHMILYESQLTASGACYDPVVRYPLRG